MLRVTVALHVKVFDGIVLATDSATTFQVLVTPPGVGPPVLLHQVYNNADKIFHLHRQLPVAAMTFGLGAVGPASISSLSKSFRLQLMGRDPNYPDSLDIDNFTVEDIAKRASAMFAQAATDAGMTQWPDAPDGLGYVVAGMSTDCDQAEVWSLKFEGATLEPDPEEVFKHDDYRIQVRIPSPSLWIGCSTAMTKVSASRSSKARSQPVSLKTWQNKRSTPF